MKIQCDDVNKVRKPFRVIAAVVSFCCAIAIAITIGVFISEGFDLIGFIFLIPICWVAHLSFKVAKTGYPPKYLLWGSSKK